MDLPSEMSSRKAIVKVSRDVSPKIKLSASTRDGEPLYAVVDKAKKALDRKRRNEFKVRENDNLSTNVAPTPKPDHDYEEIDEFSSISSSKESLISNNYTKRRSLLRSVDSRSFLRFSRPAINADNLYQNFYNKSSYVSLEQIQDQRENSLSRVSEIEFPSFNFKDPTCISSPITPLAESFLDSPSTALGSYRRRFAHNLKHEDDKNKKKCTPMLSRSAVREEFTKENNLEHVMKSFYKQSLTPTKKKKMAARKCRVRWKSRKIPSGTSKVSKFLNRARVGNSAHNLCCVQQLDCTSIYS